MNTDLVPATPTAVNLGVLSGSKPADLVAVATDVANALADIIASKTLFNTISGRRYVRVEGWTTLAVLLGCLPREVSATRLEDGTYEAVVELVRIADGMVLARASAECGADEPTWANRPHYARRSMAVTRATSKACRIAFSWVMALAGYEVTPAEEIPHDGDGVVTRDTMTAGGGPVMPFGKTKGKPLSQLTVDELQSALKWCKDTDANKFRDLIANLSSELAKRSMTVAG